MSTNESNMVDFGRKIGIVLQISYRVSGIEKSLEYQNSRITLLMYKSVDAEASSRINNFIFYGFPERTNEDCCDTIKSFLRDTMRLHEYIVIDRAHRL
ncbi:hypothetical protein DPMN_014246 [Dreissena polymorpha]|uniref:Uncharacterized protein n=1 Tax=Dreissena polymorpha TaxID=45954 RepID=A0A9D4S2J1_DREPO|nr:hypothetical protein DPMN_014246 [Dreissena polymorpha]